MGIPLDRESDLSDMECARSGFFQKADIYSIFRARYRTAVSTEPCQDE